MAAEREQIRVPLAMCPAWDALGAVAGLGVDAHEPIVIMRAADMIELLHVVRLAERICEGARASAN